MLRRVLCSVLLFCIIFAFVSPSVSVLAEETDEIPQIEKTSVMDDLAGMTMLNGKPFDIADYPADPEGKLSILQFVENMFPYDQSEDSLSQIGLYIYLYNPKEKPMTNTGGNAVNIASADDQYSNQRLKCVDSSTGDCENRFLKLKIVYPKNPKRNFYYAYDKNAIRVYKIADISMYFEENGLSDHETIGTEKHELRTGELCNVSLAFSFEGFSKGYGPDPDAGSTLTCQFEKLDSLKLDVQHTFYRTLTSDNPEAGHQTQVNSVYFSVPNKVFVDYGSLQNIYAEWYEFLTKDIVVTKKYEYYEIIEPLIGVSTADFEEKLYLVSKLSSMGVSGNGAAAWGWNTKLSHLVANEIETLYYIFNIGGMDVDFSEPYDKYSEMKSALPGEVLNAYIAYYSATHDDEKLNIKDGTISKDLFESFIEVERLQNNGDYVVQYGGDGKSFWKFEADAAVGEIKAWSSENFWDNVIRWGFFETLTDAIPKEENAKVYPIEVLNYDTVSKMSDKELIDKYYINYADLRDFRSYCMEANFHDETVVLFHFAVSDYFSEEVFFGKREDTILGEYPVVEEDVCQAYRAKETVFLDFDIVQLDFVKDGKLTVIPVVAAPLDIIADITPPPNVDPDWSTLLEFLKIILGLLVIVVIVVFISPVLTIFRIVVKVVWTALKVIFYILTIPIRLICRLFGYKSD